MTLNSGSGEMEGPLGARSVQEHFALRADPFSIPHDPRFLLGSKPLRLVLAKLRSLLEEGARLVVVTGDAGIGKTALVDAIVRDFKDGVPTARVLDPSSYWAEIGQEIGSQLRLDGGRLSPGAMVAEPGGERSYRIIIDRAERLSEDSLRHLAAYLDLEAPAGKAVHRVQVVLISRTSSVAPIFAWLGDRSYQPLPFESMDEAESRRYILRRLKMAGAQDRKIFSEQALHQVAHASAGVPGSINLLCRAALELAAGAGRSHIDTDTMVEAQRRVEATGVALQAGLAPVATDTAGGGFVNPLDAPAPSPAAPPKPVPLAQISLEQMEIPHPEVIASSSRTPNEVSGSGRRRAGLLTLALVLVLGILAGVYGIPLLLPDEPEEPVTKIVRVEVPVEVPVVEVPVEVPVAVVIEEPEPEPIVVPEPVEPKPQPRAPKPRPLRIAKARPMPMPVPKAEAPPAKPAPSPVVDEFASSPVEPMLEDLGPLPDAREVLTKAFAKSWVGDHTQTIELDEVATGERRLLKFARMRKNQRFLTLGVLEEPGTAELTSETRMLSIETGKVNDERFLFQPDTGSLKRLKGRQAEEAFEGSQFGYDDFRIRNVDQYLIHQIARSRLDEQVLYLISAKPRHNADYDRVEFVLDAREIVLLEVHYYRGVGLRPYRIVQYPRESMKSVGSGLVPMQVVVHDFSSGEVSEANVISLALARDLDYRMFTLTRLKDRELALPSF